MFCFILLQHLFYFNSGFMCNKHTCCNNLAGSCRANAARNHICNKIKQNIYFIGAFILFYCTWNHIFRAVSAIYITTRSTKSFFDVLTDVGKIHSSYDKLHGAGSHERMTDSEFRLLRLHPNLDATELSKLLGIARIYDVSAQRQRIIHELEVTKHKERLLG